MSTLRDTLLAAGLLGLLTMAACGSEDGIPESPTQSDAGESAAAGAVEGRWEFYPARIDDREASVLVNLGYRSIAPLADVRHLLWVNITMPEAGPGGMGSAASADRLRPIEESITKRLQQQLSARHVARIRGKGKWQLRYYAPEARDFEGAVRTALRNEGLEFSVGHDEDPDWRYYHDFLCPDEERSRWIADRRIVEQLERHHDVLTAPRLVTHWLYFETVEARAAFESSVEELGFRFGSRDEIKDGKPARPFSLSVARMDKAELESIHRVVMRLMEAAQAVGGAYDGWGCATVQKE